MLTCTLLLLVKQHLEHKPQIWQLEILVMCVFTAQCSLYDICACALYVQVIMMTIIRTFNGCSFLETNVRYNTNNTVLWLCCLFLYCTFLRLTVERLGLTVQRLGLTVEKLRLTVQRLRLTVEKLGLTVQRLGLTVQGLGLTVQRLRLTVQRL